MIGERIGDYEISCSQLCGLGHFRMRGFVNIKSTGPKSGRVRIGFDPHEKISPFFHMLFDVDYEVAPRALVGHFHPPATHVVWIEMYDPKAPDAKPLSQAQGHVRFEHVTFGYSADNTVLDDINIDAKPGETVALLADLLSIPPSPSQSSSFALQDTPPSCRVPGRFSQVHTSSRWNPRKPPLASFPDSVRVLDARKSGGSVSPGSSFAAI